MNSAPLSPQRSPSYVVVGRYAIFDEIAAGGMATVHLGRLIGAGGFSRVVAVKRLHPQFAKDAEFSAMFLDEARLAARIRHTNVVQTLDVVPVGGELLLVMEYVHGVSFAALLHAAKKRGQRVEPRLAAAVVAAMLEGLHAAHEAKSETGVPLGVVHRDVSPQNVMVGADGVPRLLDFGVAKAVGKMHATREGQLKGKLAYMSPEQVRSVDVTRQSDVFSSAIVLWEALMGQRLFDGQNPAELVMQVITQPIESPRQRFPDLPEALDAAVMKGLSRDPATRYATARDMALDLESALTLATSRELARWAEALAGDLLTARSQLVERIEQSAAATPSEDALGAESGPALRFPMEPISDRIASGLKPVVPAGSAPKADPYAATFENLAPVDAPMPPPRRRPGLGGDPLDSESGTRERPLAFRPEVPLGNSERTLPSADPGNDLLSPPAGGAQLPAPAPIRPRPIPIRVEPEEEPISLRERIETPVKVIAAGVLLSVADPLLRPFLGGIPVRPLWVAEVLVVVGVLWVAARLVMPVRR